MIHEDSKIKLEVQYIKECYTCFAAAVADLAKVVTNNQVILSMNCHCRNMPSLGRLCPDCPIQRSFLNNTKGHIK